MNALRAERALTMAERLSIIGWAEAYRQGEMSVADMRCKIDAKRYEMVFDGRAVIDRPVSAWAVLGFLNHINGGRHAG